MTTPVYLDNNATTRVDPRVVEAMLPCFSEVFGNPSSPHAAGAAAKRLVGRARRQVQALIGAADSSEIVFTSGGTESDDLAIRGALAANPERREIVISAVEHAAVGKRAATLAGEGYSVHVIPVDRPGRLDIAAYERALSERVALVSIMWANNETGTVFPVAELAARAKAVGALFHTDAVQAVGRLPIALAATRIDLLSLSGHKLHAPKGIGALYVRRGTALHAQMVGGSQERGRRAGTENVPGIVGLGTACALAAHGLADDATRIRALRDHLEAGVCKRIPDVLVLGDPEARVAGTACLAFAGIEGEAVAKFLDRVGIAVGTGSACGSGALEPSHVARAMGLPDIYLRGVVRFSLSRDTTEAEIDRTLDVLPGVIGRLRGSALAA